MDGDSRLFLTPEQRWLRPRAAQGACWPRKGTDAVLLGASHTPAASKSPGSPCLLCACLCVYVCVHTGVECA